MTSKPTVISKVVENDLCIGCGLCVTACTSKSVTMLWNNEGFLVASPSGLTCNADGACINVCPFNPNPSPDVENETLIAKTFLKDAPANHYKLGKYYGLYAGHAHDFRDTSSSGGMATYFFSKVLASGTADKIIVITESSGNDTYYEYRIIDNVANIKKSSKTRYYPVTLASVFEEIKALDGTVAVAGVGCFIKAIRLMQNSNPLYAEKISFLVGIICGGVKSKFFTEYLASSAGVSTLNIQSPDYRLKAPASTASNYSFGCIDRSDDQLKTIKMKNVGDMWGTGMFKANACDYCDDVTTELADVSLGDAWIEPYSLDGRGTNVVITRSTIAERIVQEGLATNDLTIEEISQEKMISSQRGSFNHRHDGMAVRIVEAKIKRLPVSPKRQVNYLIGLDLVLVQLLRRLVRKKSLQVWASSPDANQFRAQMKKSLLMLRIATRINHLKKRLYGKFKALSGSSVAGNGTLR